MHTFGIEIETLLPISVTQQAVAEAISQAGVPCNAAGYTHRTSGQWKVVSDGSLGGRNGFAGHEVVSRVLSENDLGEVNAVCRALSSLGATVNRTCGLHVHIGARGFTLNHMKRLALLYAECEPFLDSLLPPSRRANNNTYCNSVATTINKQRVLEARQASDIAANIARGMRYAKLNFASFWKHGTVEFRHHSGTVDPEKIRNWVQLCARLVDAARREADLIQAVAPAAPTATNCNPYWRRGRQRRVVYLMLSRVEGATLEEIRQRLGTVNPPSLVTHARRSGDAISRSGRRDGQWAYRFASSLAQPQAQVSAAELPPAPTSLDAFLEKLQVTPSERTYWSERAELLSANA